MEDVFKEQYQILNTEQRAAVDTTEGPVMVIAGPGTGKTQILTLRIANILRETDTEPENILALTFTESAAVSMRNRLRAYIGAAAYRVKITTFHSFCNDIITDHPESFPRIIGAVPIHDVDQVSLIQEVLDQVAPKVLRPYGDPYLYVKDIISSIAELKREGIEPDQFTRMTEEARARHESADDKYHTKGAHKGKVTGAYRTRERLIAKNEELSRIYLMYQELLFNRRYYDYSDMIMEVLRAFSEDEDLLLEVQERYQYVLVDEHQDTNRAQNMIVERVMSFHAHPNVFVVGDEKQAIFRFQGASLENFNYFKDRFPGATLITLAQNYRSTQPILNSAENLLGGKLSANVSYDPHPIEQAVVQTFDEESAYVAFRIEQLLAAGVPAGEIAILYRNNRDAAPFIRILEKVGVPYVLESDYNLLEAPDVQRVLKLLRAVAWYEENEYVGEALHVDCFSVAPADVYQLIRAAHDKKLPLYKLLIHGSIPNLADSHAVAAFAEALTRWIRTAKNGTVTETVEEVLRESGLITRALKSEHHIDRVQTLQHLLSEVNRLEASHPRLTLKELFTHLDAIEQHKLFLKRKTQAGGEGRVRLMTVHRAKGLEFQHVFIVRAVDGVFGGRRIPNRLPLLPAVYGGTESAGEDDERRLFYVALTRAKQHVYITAHTYNAEGREQVPSAFVTEIKEDLIVDAPLDDFYKWYEQMQETLIAGGKLQVSAAPDAEFVQHLFLKNGLSVTALNNYLACPWRYFYRNLLRLPESVAAPAQYGTAVHAALRDFYEKHKAGEGSEVVLIESFKRHMNRSTLDEVTRNDLLEHGAEVLSGYYRTYEGTFPIDVLTEFSVNGVFLRDDILLRGTLDRIDLSGSTVRVTDYKTKKPMSKNAIMGKTKSDTGDYHRQLVFYKLLLNRYDDGKYVMNEGTIDFIEPNDRGVYKKETFAISDTEVAELAKTIERAADEIMSLSFWESTCGDADCRYCNLRTLSEGVS